MRISSCRLYVTAVREEDFPRDGRPQIAFMGRSNVGKSSLINRLLGRRNLAYTSRTPGRTRAINFYLINDRAYFVDLPGYGYARVPEPVRREWKGLVESYLEGEGRPDLAVQLVDARHEPTDLDRQLLEWLRDRGIARRVVMTKTDNLPGSRKAAALTRGERHLGLGPEESAAGVSAVTGDGIPALWKALDEACAARRSPPTISPPPGGGGVPDGGRSSGREPPRRVAER